MHLRLARSCVLTVALAALIGTSGCVVREARPAPPPPPVAEIIAPTPPPPIRVEVVPEAPRPREFVEWEPGHWHWDGYQYRWIPGHYVERPHREAVYVPGHWDQRPNGTWVWIGAHWR